MQYRALSDDEIVHLEQNGCQAESWKKILVKDGFEPSRISQTRFSGEVRLGIFSKQVNLYEQVAHPTGVYNSHIVNCTIGDDALISGVRYLVNYNIEDGVVLDHVSTIIVTGESTFGNGTEIEVFNEGGGRELQIYDQLSAQVAYMLVAYRHAPSFVKSLSDMITKYVQDCKSSQGTIEKGARVINCGDLKNVHIGPDARLEGCLRLEEGTVASSRHDPVFIGAGVIARNFIIQSGSKVDSGSLLANCFVGQGVQIGKQFSAENSAFFANCEGFHGEACSVFAGPYSVTHHKSTLLIAGMFSFYNAGSGTNQSNHMYKLGPVHQGFLERGSKTGSFSYLLWPSRAGAFNVIVGKHYANFDTSDLPFSYVLEDNGKTILIPAINLFTVGTRRDSKKWPTRDRRKDPEKYDLIHFDLFSPYVMGKISRGIHVLKSLYDTSSPEDEFVTYKGVHIKRNKLLAAASDYELVVDIFVGNEILRRLKSISDDSDYALVNKILCEPFEPTAGEWVDIAGLFAPKSIVEEFMHAVSENKLDNVAELQTFLHDIYSGYDEACWAWCADLINQRIHKKVSELTADDLAGLILKWRHSSVKFNNLILKDSEKEFSQRSRIGFGIDGDESTAEQDFTAVRGTYDKNKFVQETIAETRRIEETAERWLEILKA